MTPGTVIAIIILACIGARVCMVLTAKPGHEIEGVGFIAGEPGE